LKRLRGLAEASEGRSRRDARSRRWLWRFMLMTSFSECDEAAAEG